MIKNTSIKGKFKSYVKIKKKKECKSEKNNEPEKGGDEGEKLAGKKQDSINSSGSNRCGCWNCCLNRYRCNTIGLGK